MTATVSFLPVTLRVHFDPVKELSARNVGPIFTDEYRSLMQACMGVRANPYVDMQGEKRLQELEAEHAALASRFMVAWTRLAKKIAEQRNITLVPIRDKNLTNSPPSQHFHDEISALISVNEYGDTWKVVTENIPPVRS